MTADLESLIEEARSRLTLDQKVMVLTGRDAWTLHPLPDVGLTSLVMSDGPVGVRGTQADERDPSLCLPNPATIAATWDPSVSASAGALAGADARRKGVHVLLAPTIGLHRSPLGGRNFEAWSEDPLLTGRLAAAFVRGVQRQGVAACAKHFIANDTETQRMSYDARVAPDVLRELYLRPFADLVEAGVWTVMASYNRLDGVHLTAHGPMLQGLLKGEWGFDGVVISDWHAAHGDEPQDATAGLDVVMPGPDGPWGDALVAAVADGRVAEEVVDDKVRRLLRLAARTGALDAPVGPPAPRSTGVADGWLRDIAARGTVLLANDGVLPLPGEATVAVIGEPATRVAVQGGGSAHVEPVHVVQPLEALRTALGAERVRTAPGVRVARLLPPLPVAWTSVDGEEGVLIEAVDADGAVMSSEHRRITGLPPLATVETAAHVIRLRTRLAPDAPVRRLSVAAVGQAVVRVDGRELTRAALGEEAGDPVEAFMRPPEHRVDVDWAAGEAVDLEVEVVRDARLPMGIAVLRVGHEVDVADDDGRIAEAADAARGADVAVVVVGTNDDVESEGFDRPHLRLPGRQDEMVEAVTAANPRTVVVANAGSVYELPWADDVAAVVWAGLGGQEAGAAIADVLTGAVEPGGRLPTTFWRRLEDAPVSDTRPVDGVMDYAEGHHVGYRAHLAGGAEPRYPFGHGLGYTVWEYEDAELERDGTAVLVRIRNTGSRGGREVVQAYLRHPDVATRLVGFAAAEAVPGGDVVVRVGIDRRAASRWDAVTGRWSPLLGGELVVGPSAGDIRLQVPVDRLAVH